MFPSILYIFIGFDKSLANNNMDSDERYLIRLRSLMIAFQVKA